MLARVLLHMIATPGGIDAAVNRGSRSQRLSGEMQDTAVFLVRDFGNRYFPFVSQHQPAGIVNLAAAGGIKRGAIENDGVPAFALNVFDDASIKGVEKRVVVVEASSHKRAVSIQLLLKSRAAARDPYCDVALSLV